MELDRRFVGEKLPSIIDGQAQDVRDVLVAIGDFQRLGVIAGSLTGGAGGIDAGQKQQLDHHKAFALAVIAAPLAHVE